ncbi:PAB-dependent poly(A)-specific ribonuclease subunit PAN3 [Sodiomyces alkalinus F11]|uniref:PAN2-PAN3 deadenylation complex subunit PAN3 n=1 Tax=Sodiomyces alkalinus (strain CBS 110278 / VKM F-3762 / F11) TaxID=1314773 RepID=A0A3N2Q4R8_SODAK|nr:PAB-dependent poly(A)-specific ribonuclease subunit PAN3 [Sodiomyces alkalinus F11]ROT41658.1 PAB-dependent poly(A)-specific ribonuclease subunit PAN3 [Sodiomyces alkalinus F11]
MAASRYNSPDLRRQVGTSPKPKTRDTKDTLCRNVLIYGHCRYENSGCAFNHDQNRNNSSQNSHSTQTSSENGTKKLNVDSPSFTPTGLQSTTTNPSTPTSSSKRPTFSTQAASAASFVPRGAGLSKDESTTSVFNPAKFQEFKPQNYDLASNINANGTSPEPTGLAYDPFSLSSIGQTLPTPQYNPYAEDPTALGGTTAFFQQQNTFVPPMQPLQYHLYAPLGQPRDGLLPYQRQTHDFFLPEKLREDAQRKLEAAHQVLANSALPNVDHFTSLVPLDTNNRESSTIFGYTSWVYKAVSQENGRTYCLRRIKDFRLSNENAIRSVKEWKRVHNGSVVSVHSAFTTRRFQDSSIIFVYDFHPLSKTLSQQHFTQTNNRYNPRTTVTEDLLWSYITQIANALRAIHKLNLAARCLDPSKIILTEKNRIRLSACSILDVLQYDARRPLQDLQQDDLAQFGKVMLCLASNTPPSSLNNNNAPLIMQQLSAVYSEPLVGNIMWLLFPPQSGETKTIDAFLTKISGQIMSNLDMLMHQNDGLNSTLYQEIENGRLFRLLCKLGTINERQEFDGDRQWSENGERYMIKLFRDYVFHQVDSNGQPVVDMGHIVRCLNKLDAGTEERICLTSRDDQSAFVVSYKELKKQIGSAFGELLKGRTNAGRGF